MNLCVCPVVWCVGIKEDRERRLLEKYVNEGRSEAAPASSRGEAVGRARARLRNCCWRQRCLCRCMCDDRAPWFRLSRRGIRWRPSRNNRCQLHWLAASAVARPIRERQGGCQRPCGRHPRAWSWNSSSGPASRCDGWVWCFLRRLCSASRAPLVAPCAISEQLVRFSCPYIHRALVCGLLRPALSHSGIVMNTEGY